MDLLNKLAGQWANHTFAALLIDPAQQDHFSRRLFQQMRNIAADGDDGDIAALGQRAGEQGVAAPVLDKHRLSGRNARCGPRSQLSLNGEVGHHAGFHIFAIQRNGEAVSTTQVALLLE